MSKQHVYMIANVLKGERDRIKEQFQGCSQAVALAVLDQATTSFAAELSDTNSTFDRNSFLSPCGLKENGSSAHARRRSNVHDQRL
jgi:hypothetical protein